jgi:hypothetical protein
MKLVTLIGMCLNETYGTNIDTLVTSLYQCVETRSIEVF